MATVDMSRIASNIGAINALNSLTNVNRKLAVAQTRLATGMRINTAEDDPAGYVLGTKFRARASGMQVALDSIGDAKNLLSVMDGGLRKISDLLIKIRDKAEQAVSDTLGSSERAAIDQSIDEFLAEIDELVNRNQWNGDGLLAGAISKVIQTGASSGDTTTLSTTVGHSVSSLGLTMGTSASSVSTISTITDTVTGYSTAAVASGKSQIATGTYTVQVVGAGTSATFRLLDQYGNAVQISSTSAGTGSLTSSFISLASHTGAYDTGRGLSITFGGTTASFVAGEAKSQYTASGGGVDSSTNATSYLANVDTAIATVSGSLNRVGSQLARLTAKEEEVAVGYANTEAAYNRIMNADMAREQVEATKGLILQQVSTAMLAQANSSPQGILSLFR